MFRRYILPFLLLLGLVLLVTGLLPEDKRIQVITPPITIVVTGVLMRSLDRLLRRPDVVIEDLDQEVSRYLSIRGTLVNNSSTGEGELKTLVLRIFLDEQEQEYLDTPVERGEPDIIGFRFQPHGLLPIEILYFKLPDIDENIIAGKPAEIRFKVVGQDLRTYKVRMSDI